MKVIIAGGRDITNRTLVDKAVKDSGFEITEVVSGMALGIDMLGEQWSVDNNIPIKLFPADWDAHGLSAGPLRNRSMAQYADALIIIWSGKSKGSKNMKDHMARLKKPIYEVIVDGTI